MQPCSSPALSAPLSSTPTILSSSTANRTPPISTASTRLSSNLTAASSPTVASRPTRKLRSTIRLARAMVLRLAMVLLLSSTTASPAQAWVHTVVLALATASFSTKIRPSITRSIRTAGTVTAPATAAAMAAATAHRSSILSSRPRPPTLPPKATAQITASPIHSLRWVMALSSCSRHLAHSHLITASHLGRPRACRALASRAQQAISSRLMASPMHSR